MIILATFSLLTGIYFYRDFVFINSNSQIKYITEVEQWKAYAETTEDFEYFDGVVRNWTHSKMEAQFEGWTIDNLISYKWKMTFLFTLSFMGIAALGLALLKENKILLLSIGFYIVLFGLAFIINYFNYSISRDIIGLLHSPLPFLIFITFTYVNSLLQKNEEQNSI